MLESVLFQSGLSFIIAVVGTFAGYKMGRHNARKAQERPILVEEYRIEELESDGFREVLVKFHDANQSVHKFKFHPAYAHHFSDDLVKHAARTLAPKTT
jgi:hypothetical protein